MTKSLYKVLILTAATTALSTIPTFASTTPELETGAPNSAATHLTAAKSHLSLLQEMRADEERFAKALEGVFSPAHIQAALKVLNEAAGMAEIGLSAAEMVDPKNKKLATAVAGLGTGVKVLTTVGGDLSAPGGLSGSNVKKALVDTEEGVGEEAGLVGGKGGAAVKKGVDEAEEATTTLLGTNGVPTTASALSAGAAIASDVGGKGGTTAAAVLSAVSAAEQAQQGVQTAVDSARPIPPAAPPSSPTAAK